VAFVSPTQWWRLTSFPKTPADFVHRTFLIDSFEVGFVLPPCLYSSGKPPLLITPPLYPCKSSSKNNERILALFCHFCCIFLRAPTAIWSGSVAVCQGRFGIFIETDLCPCPNFYSVPVKLHRNSLWKKLKNLLRGIK
jgi:hypothetical protein